MGSLRRFIRQDRDYFFNNQPDIQWQNNRVLRSACVIYLVVLIIYTFSTLVLDGGGLLFFMYLGFDLVHILLCICVFLGSPFRGGEKGGVRACCTVLEITLLLFFLLEAVFPFPGETSIYFPFPIILLVTILIIPVWHALAVTASYVVAFIVLVLLFKYPEVRAHDVYIAAATFFSAIAGYVIVASLRHETCGTLGKLKSLSMTDSMTGLYNKRSFETLCRSYMDDKGHNRGYALLFFDVDKFKLINDTYGHQKGDEVLKSIADVMRETFYEKDYLCRFGGDEFVVFMVDIRSEADVNETIRKFCVRVGNLAAVLDVESVSCSVGSAMKSDKIETYAELLSRADAALYVAKESGRQQVSYTEQELIQRILRSTGARPDSSGRLTRIADTGERRAPLRRILIVDDNEMNRQLLRKILFLNYDVLEAKDGEAAMAILSEWHESISVVLLDIVMPVMDGYELLRRMRADEELRAIPVIVTTGYGEEEAEIKALSLGANDFVVKPYRPAIIIHRLQNTINLRETNAILAAVRNDY